MTTKILIVDDEEPICEILKYNLELNGYEVEYELSAEEALQRGDLPSFSLMILDIMMGDMSGFDMAKRLKNNIDTEYIPIIFCSALDTEDSTVKGLNMGGDDYITKPFVINEVLARVRAVLRRSNPQQPPFAHSHISTPQRPGAQKTPPVPKNTTSAILAYRTLRIDTDKKLCSLDGEQLGLTKTEFEILSFFLRNRNRIYSREEIINAVWPDDVVVSNRTIDTNITRLRKKIGEYGGNITTRLGFGYGFQEAD